VALSGGSSEGLSHYDLDAAAGSLTSLLRDMMPNFSEATVRLIVKSLPDGVNAERLKLLPQVLREWSAHYLPYLLYRPDPKVVNEQAKCLEQIGKLTGDLLNKLNALDTANGTSLLISQLSQDSKLSPRPRRAAFDDLFTQHGEFLASINLAALRMAQKCRSEKDQRRNIPAYLVLVDIAGIFEWLTDTKAVRRTEYGQDQFGEFARAVWPVVFEKGDDGLPAALKNWASYRKKYHGLSPFMANKHRWLSQIGGEFS
jgi:hypothetical protein